MENQYILSISSSDQVYFTIPELEEHIISELESLLDLKNLLLINKHYFELISNDVRYKDFRSFFMDAGAGHDYQLIKEDTWFKKKTSRVHYGYRKMSTKQTNSNKISITLSFYLACEKNHLHMTKYLMKKYPNELVWKKIENGFWDACVNGYLDICQFMYQSKFHTNFKTKNFDGEMISSCSNGCLDSAKWILSVTKIERNILDQIFREACTREHLDIARLIFYLNDSKIDIHLNNEELFRNACQFGNTYTMKFLLSLDKNIDIHILNDESFRNSCEFGNLDVAKLLYQISLDNNDVIDIHRQDDYAFKNSCENGYIEVAKWLYSLDTNMNVDWHRILLINCESNNIHFVKWINSLDVYINIHGQKEKIFRTCCRLGNFKLVKYLHSQSLEINSPINIRAVGDYAFRISCQNGYFKIAHWLYEISQTNNDSIDVRAKHDQAFKCSCQRDHFEIAEWLCTLYHGYRIVGHNKRSLRYKIVN